MADDDSEFYYILTQPDRQRDHRDREMEKERDRDDRARERGRERERERDTQKNSSSSFLGSPHRRDSATTRASSPGPSSRRSTFDSAMKGSGATKRPRSPALSTSSDQLERLRKDNQRHTNDRPPSRRDYIPSASRRSRSRSRDKGRDRERADLPSKKSPAGRHVLDTRHTSVSTVQHPATSPPEPPKPPPMQPPPPPPPPQVPEVPKVPSFASNQQTTTSAETASKRLKELSMDEQRSAWHERIEYAHIVLFLVH